MPVQPAFFSIVIPTYNRPAQLADCLTAISEQSYHRQGFEVIVVNDGGVPLDDVIERFKQHLEIVLIEQQNTGPAQARNRGATVAQGEFLIFADDDCRPAEDCLQQIAIAFMENPDALIGGQTLNCLSNNLYAIASQLIVDLAYQYFNPQPDQAQFFASNNMVFPRRHFLKIGGFHPDFRTSEDREICDRWLRNHHTMIYRSAVKIYHAHSLTLLSFWKQHLGYGRGAFRYHTIRAQRGEPPFRPDPTFYRRLLSHPFSKLPLQRAAVVSGLMGLSQLASLIGYLLEKRQFPQPLEASWKKPLPLLRQQP